MSDVTLRKETSAESHEPIDRPADVLVLIPAIKANDNETASARKQPEARMFELPASIWTTMIACYGVFLIALLGATGGAHAAFAIAICTIYVSMFFGTARFLLRNGPPQSRSPLKLPGATLQTAFGPMKRGAVYGQILIVPAVVSFFGVCIAIIRAAVG